MASSEIEFWIAQVRAGTLSIDDTPKSLHPVIRDVLQLDTPRPAQLRTDNTTVTLEEYQAGVSQKRVLDSLQKRISGSISRAGPAPPVAPRVEARASGMAEIIAYLEAAPDEAANVGSAFLSAAYGVRKDMETIAIALVDQRRRRRGWAARYNYPDRTGRHYLEEAIRGSAVVQSDIGGAPHAKDIESGRKSSGRQGTGLAMVGWDYERLEAMTRPPRSARGFIYMYEQGGTTIMPPGFWIGPTGPNTLGQTAKRFQKGPGKKGGGVARMRAQAGVDRFYPGSGPTGVYMHEPAMHVLRDALEAANSRVAQRLRAEFAGSINMEKAARARASGTSSEISEVYSEDAYTANVDK